MSQASARWSLVFSCVGHSYSHLFAPMFYVVVLALEGNLGLSHGETVSLIVWGNILFGVAAPLAGWLGDKWKATGMMLAFFLGTGGGMILTGLASSPSAIALGLAVTGLFASIYHPVGMAWLVRNAANRGVALGVNGLFGGLGPAVAALSAGALVDAFGWRSAFLVPGVVVVTTGLLFAWVLARGTIVESKVDRHTVVPASRRDAVRAFAVLAVTMLCIGLIYQSTQAGLPKLFSVRLKGLMEGGVFGISALVAVVYLASGMMQIVAGRFADRFPLRTVYLTAFGLQVPFLYLAGVLGGGGLLTVAVIMVVLNAAALPAENTLVARYAPPNWRGLAYGLKFILAFGVSGLGVLLEGQLYDMSGDFVWLFTLLAAVAAGGTAIGFLLPNERPGVAAVAEAPAE